MTFGAPILQAGLLFSMMPDKIDYLAITEAQLIHFMLDSNTSFIHYFAGNDFNLVVRNGCLGVS